MGKKEKGKKSAKTLSTREILRSIEAKKRRRKYYFLAVLILIVTAIGIIAATRTPSQQTGNLMIHVVDPAENIVHGATITISGPYTTSVVAEHGVYTFQSIPIGTYLVTANAPGYRQGEKTIIIEAGQTSHLTVSLSPSQT